MSVTIPAPEVAPGDVALLDGVVVAVYSVVRASDGVHLQHSGHPTVPSPAVVPYSTAVTVLGTLDVDEDAAPVPVTLPDNAVSKVPGRWTPLAPGAGRIPGVPGRPA